MRSYFECCTCFQYTDNFVTRSALCSKGEPQRLTKPGHLCVCACAPEHVVAPVYALVCECVCAHTHTQENHKVVTLALTAIYVDTVMYAGASANGGPVNLNC